MSLTEEYSDWRRREDLANCGPAVASEVVSVRCQQCGVLHRYGCTSAASQSEQIARLTRENELLRNRARAFAASGSPDDYEALQSILAPHIASLSNTETAP